VRDYRREDRMSPITKQTLIKYNTKKPQTKIKERVNPKKKEDSLWQTDLKAPQKIQAARKKERWCGKIRVKARLSQGKCLPASARV